MRIINVSKEAKAVLSNLKNDYNLYSEMAPSEQEFLSTLILEYKPQNVLEVGVAAGSSSVLLLNALNTLSNKHLTSVEYSRVYYRDQSKMSGFIVDNYPQFKENWTFFSGGMISDFFNQITPEIDFCFIDTVHSLPGEIFDFLCVFPLLKKNAVVLLHDINLHTWRHPSNIVNGLLISALSGEKLIPETHEKLFYHNTLQQDIMMPFVNVAAVELSDQYNNIWDIFNLLTQKWAYFPPDNDLNSIRSVIKSNYSNYFLDFFDTVVSYQKTNKELSDNQILELQKWCEQLQEAKEYFLQQIENRDKRITELERERERALSMPNNILNNILINYSGEKCELSYYCHYSCV